MTQTMRAAVLVEPGRFEIEERPLPAPGPGELRLRLQGSGVCASNLPPFEGREWFRYPMPPGALGHEGWGLVDAIGPGVTGFSEGMRVASLGGAAYATHDIVAADAVVPLPRALDGQPFPGEPLGCGVNVYRRADLGADDTVAIIGLGFIGAVVCALAADAGARVVAISRRQSSLELARAYGARHCIEMRDHQAIIDEVMALTGGDGCARVVEAAGAQWPLDLAGALTRVRGKLVIAGYHQGARQVDMQLWNWRGLDVINAHERDPAVYREGIRGAIAAIEAGIFDPTRLYSHHLPLEAIGEALALTRDRPEGFVKALIRHD